MTYIETNAIKILKKHLRAINSTPSQCWGEDTAMRGFKLEAYIDALEGRFSNRSAAEALDFAIDLERVAA